MGGPAIFYPYLVCRGLREEFWAGIIDYSQNQETWPSPILVNILLNIRKLALA